MAVSKSKQRPGVVDAKTQRLNVRVTSDAYERLLVHAIKARKSPGDLITGLIDRHLREYSMPGKLSARAMSPDSASGAGGEENSLQDAA